MAFSLCNIANAQCGARGCADLFQKRTVQDAGHKDRWFGQYRQRGIAHFPVAEVTGEK